MFGSFPTCVKPLLLQCAKWNCMQLLVTSGIMPLGLQVRRGKWSIGEPSFWKGDFQDADAVWKLKASNKLSQLQSSETMLRCCALYAHHTSASVWSTGYGIFQIHNLQTFIRSAMPHRFSSLYPISIMLFTFYLPLVLCVWESVQLWLARRWHLPRLSRVTGIRTTTRSCGNWAGESTARCSKQ